MTTSLSTMATTLSMDCTAALAAVPRNSAPSISGRRQSESLVFTFTITFNAFVEEALYLGAGQAAESFEDNLEEEPVVTLFVQRGDLAVFVVGNPVTVDDAQFPAAVVVLETTEGFQGTVAGVIVLPAGDQVPLGNDRPHHREVVLLDFVVILHVVRGVRWNAIVTTKLPFAGQLVVDHLVVTIAITEVDDLVRVVFWLVVEHRAAGTRGVAFRVPVVIGSGAPVAVEAELVVQGDRRNIRLCVCTVGGQDAWQLNFAILEVHGLADADALTFEAVFFDP